MYNINDTIYAANILGVEFNKFTPEEFLIGLNVEKEHGLIKPLTNVTDDNIITTATIALAHLHEFPNYYNKKYGLLKFEEFLKQKMNEK